MFSNVFLRKLWSYFFLQHRPNIVKYVSVEAISKHWPSTAFTNSSFWSWWFIWLTDLFSFKNWFHEAASEAVTLSTQLPLTCLSHGHALQHSVLLHCFKYYHQGSQRHREWLFLGHFHPGTAGELRPCGFLRRTRTVRVRFESQWSSAEDVAGVGIQRVILSDFACSPAVNVRRHYLMFDRIPGTSVPWICFWQNGLFDVFVWEFEGAWFMVLIWHFCFTKAFQGHNRVAWYMGSWQVIGSMTYDLQPTGPHPASHPGSGLGGSLSWWRGWWPAGPAMGSGVMVVIVNYGMEDVVCHWPESMIAWNWSDGPIFNYLTIVG